MANDGPLDLEMEVDIESLKKVLIKYSESVKIDPFILIQEIFPFQ